MTRTGAGEGWPLLGWAALGLLALGVGVWAASPGGEAGVRALIRASARSSLVLFLLAAGASSFHRLRPTPATEWLLRNRRPVGVSFALSHSLHLAAIGVLAARWPHPFLEDEGRTTALVGGGIAYVFILALAATSWDGAVRRLGAQRWKALHLVGIHYVWTIFFFANARRAVALSPAYALPTAALLAVLGLRLATRRPAGAGDHSAGRLR